MTQINQSEIKKFEVEGVSLFQQAQLVKVVDQVTFAGAAELDKILREKEKRVEEYFKPIKKTLDAAKGEVLAKEKEALKPIQEARHLLRDGPTGMNRFLTEQERIRKEEEARLQRLAEEAARKEREKLLAQAAKAEEKGKEEKAEALRGRAEDVYVFPVTVAAQGSVKTGNVTAFAQMKTKGTVTDLKAFLTALLAQGYFPSMVEINYLKLNAWIKANGIKRFPGLAIEEEVKARVR